MSLDLYEIPNLGLFHFNLVEASNFIAESLWYDGDIDFTLGDKEYLTDEEIEADKDLLTKQNADFYFNVLLKAVKAGSLKAVLIGKTIDEDVIPEDTYIEAEVLNEWLNDRAVYLKDGFNSYYDNEISVQDSAVNAIEAERIKLKNPEAYNDHEGTNKELILYEKVCSLEAEIEKLQLELEQEKLTAKAEVKKLHPKREASLLRLALVMAKKGYCYDETASKSPIPKEIEEDAQKMGVKLTDDTIRAILKESVEYLDDL